ncbi:MAG: carboxypeptidase regulatory-like domain-containing protein [Deltaproteobacteria bacterium]|nr:carboxypeptidase regulatory-like domain-containing protein [Deltaproteobacteria bacterium]
MVIDVDKCVGCHSCFLSCRDEFCGNDFPSYSASQPYKGHFWMRVLDEEQGKFPKVKLSYIPIPCLHCKDAPCVAASKDNAVYKRPDGIVIIDPEKAVGQKQIVRACPYGVIFWNEEKNIPQKCTLCAHLLDQGWKEPRCVEACPTGALTFGNLEDPESNVSKLIASDKVEQLHPEYGLKTNVMYMNLPKRFIAGEVVLGDNMGECAENVSVALKGNNTEIDIVTDNYGDFEFEGLESDKEYHIKIEHRGYKPWAVNVKTGTDVNLGEIVLDPA